MAARGRIPRTVADATRFTASTPHANAKSPAWGSAAASSAPTSASRQPPPPSSSSRGPPPPGSRQPQQTGGGAGRGIPPHGQGQGQQRPAETIEERVRRLRAAHLAAKQHDVSRLDRVVESSRKAFNAAHKITVMGLVGFSGLALFVTIYATADMMIYNRTRRHEFFALQQKLKEDSLEAARLAYMTGKATEEQIAMVEEATAKAEQAGISLPPLLSAPQPAAPPIDFHGANGAAPSTTPRSVFPGEALTESSMSMRTSEAEESAQEEKEKKKGGLTSWLFSGLKKEDDESLSFSREEAGARGAEEAQQHGFLDQAKAALDQERENQRRGGPLDQVGTDAAGDKSEKSKKKGWLW
ncbi:hypothetical protein SLS62_003492 [Diatrype stigma]|uniref:Uncharacterized protein n=1 Tax=Diatrype stigma TaxID=117547 RepID=A0AAN9YTW5_9PEZI